MLTKAVLSLKLWFILLLLKIASKTKRILFLSVAKTIPISEMENKMPMIVILLATIEEALYIISASELVLEVNDGSKLTV